MLTYRYHSSGSLKVAKCSDPSCTSAAFRLVDSGDVGYASAIVTGSDGYPAISYWDGTNAHLKVVTGVTVSAGGSIEATPLPGGGDATGTPAGEARPPSVAAAPGTIPVLVAAGPSESLTEAPMAVVVRFPVSEPVDAGDVLVLDPLRAGRFIRATVANDPAVVGIAAGPSQPDTEGNLAAPVVNGLYATVKADAQFGVIRAGDLLVASATPGFAMKAPDVIAAGTVIGKALEPLETGTGTIKLLVMPR